MQPAEKPTKTKETLDLASLESSIRVKQLAIYGAMVEVDPNVPPRRYYRSGLEMVRMANVYLAEGSLENAYILYLKFMTLFLEKMRKHPEYESVPVEVRAVNQSKLKEVMPKAEKLKERLLHQYKEENAIYKQNEAHRRASQNARQQEQRDASLARRLQDGSKLDGTTTKPHLRHSDEWASCAPSAPPVDSVVYPDDCECSTSKQATNKSKQAQSIPTWQPHTGVGGTGMEGELRTVRIPRTLATKFLKIAAPITAVGIEVCGILAGILEKNELKITHLIIPKQTGAQNQCSAHNEEEYFHYQDVHQLLTIGWIHTHPTQTAFLSSIDVHTQMSYQLMMPEAIAIVCAPTYNDVGYFSLTPEGMKVVGECQLSGFHPHACEQEVYTTATHIKFDDGMSIEVADLRTMNVFEMKTA